MSTRRRSAFLAVALASIVAALAPTASAQDATTADEPLVLRVGTAEDMVTDNPFFACCAEYEMLNMTYDMLLAFDPEDLSATSGLAEECVPSDDHMTWTCTLRPGLSWSDGTPLTAADVAFTYRFIVENRIPQYRGYFPFSPTFEAPDDTTLIWRAEEPTFAPIVPPYVYVVPEHVWAEYDGEETKTIKAARNTPAIGSGPFTLVEWRQGEYWRMERNPHYWGPEPAVDEVIFQVFSSEESMVQALRNGDVDVVSTVPPALVPSLEAEEGIEVQRTLSDWWLNLAFNFGGQGEQATNDPALHDLDVRRAIAHAIDKATLVDRVYLGTAEPGDTVIRPASAFWHLDVPAEEEYAFDPAEAARLLDGAGYVDTDGDGIREHPDGGPPLVLDVVVSRATAGAVDASRLLEGWLEDVGIGVELTPVSEGKMYDYWGTGDWDAYIWYWYGDPDPDYQLSVFTSDQCGGWSDGCFADPTFDELYERQRGIFDPDERREVVYEAQRRLYEQLPGIVLAYPGGVQAYRTDRFEGWTPAPGPEGYVVFGYGNWTYVNLRPVAQSSGGGVAASSDGGVPPVVWIVAAVGVAAVGAVAFGARRRRLSDE
jgi:peptide/nickel transport system substrate-binding protein